MAIKLGVSRCMHFKITDFRAFHETIPVRVAPLTIMVGENSAGKTSFLAALRYVYDIVTSPETASFNKPPFFLGHTTKLRISEAEKVVAPMRSDSN